MKSLPISSENCGVAAGVVTYNPELPRLKENLEAIASQVRKVFVYDNASGNIEDIESLLAGCSTCIKLYKGERNKGMAVALNVLARGALEEGFSHILFLDQDSVASPCLVSKLLMNSKSSVGIVSPQVVDRNERMSNQAVDARGAIKVSRAITSGSLLNLKVFDVVGGYDERLFVDWVDFEFCDNLRVHGYEIVRVNDATLLHELGREEFAGSLPRRFPDGTVRMKAYYRTNHAIWRRKDKARSQTITIFKYHGTEICAEEMDIFWKGLSKSILFEKHKLKTLIAYISGCVDGIVTLNKRK